MSDTHAQSIAFVRRSEIPAARHRTARPAQSNGCEKTCFPAG